MHEIVLSLSVIAALLDYNDSLLGDATCGVGVGGDTMRRSGKMQTITAEKVLDAPTLVDDYCEFIAGERERQMSFSSFSLGGWLPNTSDCITFM